MSAFYVPRIVYNAVTLDLTYPLHVWDFEDEGVGGHDLTAAGVGVAFEIRRDYEVALGVRVADSEVADVRAWIAWAQRNPHLTFAFRFDATDAGTEYDVRMRSPVVGEWVTFPADHDFPGLRRFSCRLVNAAGEPFTTHASGF